MLMRRLLRLDSKKIVLREICKSSNGEKFASVGVTNAWEISVLLGFRVIAAIRDYVYGGFFCFCFFVWFVLFYVSTVFVDKTMPCSSLSYQLIMLRWKVKVASCS